MKFWLIVGCVVLLYLLYPIFRCFVKRMIGAAKLTRACRKMNYQLYKTHPLWFLGNKNGKACDFYLETPDCVYSVKLFGVPKYHTMLVFKANGDYFIRNHLAFVAWASFVKYDLNGKPKSLPKYDFRCGYREEWEIKTPRNILLIHPVAMEVRFQPRIGPEVIVGAGNVVNGMEIQSMSRFLGELRRSV